MNSKISGTHSKLSGSVLLMALAFVLSMLLLNTGCALLPEEEEMLAPPLRIPEEVTFETIEVARGTIERRLRASGRFISVSQENVQFTERGGRIDAIHVRIGQVVRKGDLLVTLDTANLEDEIRLHEIYLERAKISYDRLRDVAEVREAFADPGRSKAELELERVQREHDLNLAALEIETNNIRLVGLRRALAESKLFAPIDGNITFVSSVETGEYINAFTTLVTVADPTRLQIRYSDDRVNDFSMGMEVQLTVDRVEYTGTVVMTPFELPADASEAMQETVLIEMDELPETARIGGDAQILAILERREDTIVIPRFALQRIFGRTFVNVLVNNIREERDVEIGVQSETEIEILNGLEIGELVIIR